MTEGYIEMLRGTGVAVDEPRMWPINRLGFRIHPCPWWAGVERYRQQIRRGEDLPAIVACHDCYVILDGWHRLAAYWLEGKRYVNVAFAHAHWMSDSDHCRPDLTNWIHTLKPWLEMDCVSGAYNQRDWENPWFAKQAEELRDFGAAMPLLRFWEHVRSVIFLGNPFRRDILDVGTRESLLPAYLVGKKAQLVAMDTDISQVRVMDGVRVIPGDARNIPFDDNRFHFVISTACIKHIAGDGDTLAIREMMRVCRPGGLVAVSFDFGKEYAEYPSAATGRRIYDKEAVYKRLVIPSGGILEEPADFDRADWDDWPIKEQCREIYDKGVNVQVGFILLRKP